MSVRFALYVFYAYIDVFDGRYDCQGNMLDWDKKMSQIYWGELHDENVFAFFVLINFQLSAKHFSVLPCFFMKRDDGLEKCWTLKLTLNFRGDPSDTASAFLKMTSDFDAVITITDC